MPNLFEGLGANGALSILDIARGSGAKGIGLSRRARQDVQNYLKQSASGANSLFSAGAENSIEGAQKQILALRSSVGTTLALASQVRNAEYYKSDGTKEQPNPYNSLGIDESV